MTDLFAWVITVGADIDRGSGAAPVMSTEGASAGLPLRSPSPPTSACEDELGGIEVDEFGFRPAPVDDVVIAIIPGCGPSPYWGRDYR